MKALLAVLAIGILFAGCLGAGTQAQASVQASVEASVEATEQPSVEATEQPEATEEPTETPNELAGKTYAELLATTGPLECNVQVQAEGKTYVSQAYILNGMVRSSTEVDGEVYTAILKDDKYYLSLNEESRVEAFAECEWLFFTEAELSDYSQAGVNPSDYNELPPSSFECHAAAVDESKFAITGNACSMTEIMSSYGIEGYAG